MATDVETVVVGAGVIGLATAAALARSSQDILVLERHAGIGTEVSSHNSEVIHAGLYYPPGSLRARMCVRGRDMLYAFAAENGVRHSRLGKLLVATSDSDVPKLEQIAINARANGVVDLVKLSASEARALEPELSCVAAYLSPSTGIIDSHGLMQALEGHIDEAGSSVVLRTEVVHLARHPSAFEIVTRSGGTDLKLTCRNLVIAAGLGATSLGKMLPYAHSYTVPETYVAKGHYFALRGRAPFRHLVYPMPDGAWLGVHLTLDTGGQARFGPDIEWIDKRDGATDYAFDDPEGKRREIFEREVRRYWPGLPEDALSPGSTGIRPKLARKGEPPADFAIHGEQNHGVPGLVALYGIESPGLTASLAIAACVAAMVKA